MFTFQYFLILLLIIPLIIWSIRKLTQESSAVFYSLTGSIKKIQLLNRNRLLYKLPIILRTVALILLLMAAARPQTYNISRDIQSSGVDIILCLDTSISMRAMDFNIDGERVTRLEAVKKVVSDFIKKRKSDRIGLVVFGEEAFTQSPLTQDKGLLLGLVKRMRIGMAGDSTAIGSAIAIGGKRLKGLKAKSKILILLTDGRNNAGNISPQEAATAVAAFGIKIYTIGVGGSGPAPFLVRTIFGTRFINKNVDLDEETLKRVAGIGKGKFFLASNSKNLAEIYGIIDKAEKTKVRVKEFFHYREHYRYFLSSAIIIFLIEIILKALVFRIIP